MIKTKAESTCESECPECFEIDPYCDECVTELLENDVMYCYREAIEYQNQHYCEKCGLIKQSQLVEG